MQTELMNLKSICQVPKEGEENQNKEEYKEKQVESPSFDLKFTQAVKIIQEERTKRECKKIDEETAKIKGKKGR